MNDSLRSIETVNADLPCRCIAFVGDQCIASGDLLEVAQKAKASIDKGNSVLIFDDITSEPIEIDFRGTVDQVLKKLEPKSIAEGATEVSEKRGPGRPKLGVVAREVTLLPRHWEWLNNQPGGASVALRKLVEAARRTNAEKDRAREFQESAYRFMSAMTGNLPGYEEALRAFYRKNYDLFFKMIRTWPKDISNHVKALVKRIVEIEEPMSHQ
jgi:hypothetical protein